MRRVDDTCRSLQRLEAGDARMSGHEHASRRSRRDVFDKSLQRLEAGDARCRNTNTVRRRGRRTVFDKSLQRLEAGDARCRNTNTVRAAGGEPCLIRAFSVSKPATPDVGTRTRVAPIAARRV